MASLVDQQNIKISANFSLAEVLPPELFGRPEIDPFWYLTDFLAKVPQKLRDHFGKAVIINNWIDGGGAYRDSGLRVPSCPTGAILSMHRFGRAIDIKIDGLTPPEILAEVKKNRDKFPEITTYERIIDTPTWNHLDGRNVGPGRKELLEVPGK